VLAHPELNGAFQSDPERLRRLAQDGVLVQISARSLRPARRSRARELALQAVQEGFAHVLASDGHGADWRPPRLGAELADAQQRLPGLAERLRWMTHDAPAAILAGEPLPPAPAVAAGRRRGRFSLRGR
jgi:protein-tyrosine phosphatase